MTSPKHDPKNEKCRQGETILTDNGGYFAPCICPASPTEGLRERWEKQSGFVLDEDAIDADAVADWWLEQLSLAQEEARKGWSPICYKEGVHTCRQTVDGVPVVHPWTKERYDEVRREQREEILAGVPIYEVTEDVKDPSGKWVEFFEEKVVRLADVRKLLEKKEV